MACYLINAKPLSEPMLGYSLLIGHLGTNFSEILIEIRTFSFKKMHLKRLSVKWWHFDPSHPRLPPSVLTHLSLDKMAAILADNNFKCFFFNENDRILVRISLKCVPRSPTDNKPALVQVMAWRWTGDKPLSEPMLTQFTDAYILVIPYSIMDLDHHWFG